jgi:hypothetical protein
MNKRHYIFKGKKYERMSDLNKDLVAPLTRSEIMELTREGSVNHVRGEVYMVYEISRMYKIPYKGRGSVRVAFRKDSDGVVWGCVVSHGKLKDHTVPCYNGKSWQDKDCMTMIRKTERTELDEEQLEHIIKVYGECYIVKNFKVKFW